MSRVHRVAASTVIPITIALSAGVAWIALDWSKTEGSSADERTRPASVVQVVEGLEVAPTATAADWARIADYVVTASVESEQAIEQPKGETSSDSETLIFREVTLKVDHEVWRAPSAAKHQLPSAVTVRAMGWTRADDGGRVELAPGGGSRLEIGHTYLVALAWVPATCGEDGHTPAHWATIGSGGAVPADGDVVGDGEYEGKNGKGSRGLASPSVLASLEGRRVDAAAPLLAAVPADIVNANKIGPFASPAPAARCGSSD